MDKDDYHVYIACPNGDEGYYQQVQDWVEAQGYRIYSTYNDWRDLEGWQCHAHHGLLLGKWMQIKKKVEGVNWNPHLPDADKQFILMLKLTWG